MKMLYNPYSGLPRSPEEQLADPYGYTLVNPAFLARRHAQTPGRPLLIQGIPVAVWMLTARVPEPFRTEMGPPPPGFALPRHYCPRPDLHEAEEPLVRASDVVAKLQGREVVLK